MAAPTEPILLIATDTLGGDGFTNKEAPTAPVTNEGYGKQSLTYQQLNYMFNNQANWLKYLNEEQVPSLDTNLQNQIDTIVNTTLPNALAAAKLAMELKVGTVIEITGDSTNPATLYGYGVWSSFGAGLTTVGAGEHTDDRGESKTWADGDTEGEYNHVQTEAELAAHTTPFSGTTNNNTTATSVNTAVTAKTGDTGTATDFTGSNITTVALVHTHTFSGTTDNVGSSSPMNNTQPSIAVYRWQRTA